MTPGAWTAEEAREGGKRIVQIMAADGNVVVATVDGFSGCVEGELKRLPREEQDSNASAIAAAPALLAALRGLIARAERVEDDLGDRCLGCNVDAGDCRPECPMEQARAALAMVGK